MNKNQYDNVCFIGNVQIGKNVKIYPFCVIEDSIIEDDCVIGPFAHIRPNCTIKKGSRIGNFCEIKNSIIGENCAISHLSYVGDCEIGDNCNIGAGTIFCNYDGNKKHKTIVGGNCFIGSNSTIIAPRHIGKNCFIAGASVLREDLEDNKFYISKSNSETKNNKNINQHNNK